MNNKIKNLDLTKILLLDIETASQHKELPIDSKEYDLFSYRIRDKETQQLKEFSEVQEHYNKTAALNPIHGKVVCISVGFITNNEFHFKNIIGEEKDIITEFYTILNSADYIPTGANIINFDLPFVRLRALACGVEVQLKDKLSDAGKKEWNMTDHCCDLFQVMKGTSYGNYPLDELCYLAGVESPKDGEIKGAQVFEAFHQGRIKDIADYCGRDILATANLLLKIRGKGEMIEKVIDKSGIAREIKQKPDFFQTIMHQGFISPQQKVEILEKAGPLTKKEREEFILLLRAAVKVKELETGLEEEILKTKKAKK